MYFKKNLILSHNSIVCSKRAEKKYMRTRSLKILFRLFIFLFHEKIKIYKKKKHISDMYNLYTNFIKIINLLMDL